MSTGKGKFATKNQRRRAINKEKKQKAREKPTENGENGVGRNNATDSEVDASSEATAHPSSSEPDFTSQSFTDSAEPQPQIHLDDPFYGEFKKIFDKFKDPNTEQEKQEEKGQVFYDDEPDIPDEEEDARPKLSKKARKKHNKLSVAELKALVRNPEVLEWFDVDAQDPQLLAAVKANRNIVPVPSHWQLKRDYLSSKRGIEKPPFQLPKFLQDTGIQELRSVAWERRDQATLKQKTRERVQPKTGKMDIDYGKMYEAFFKFQAKPELTRFGEVYYEGKEYEVNMRHLKPGQLSDELKDALNMGPNWAPPWLVNQQRIGPPPSYPSLTIPGLNAPPPPGASWGYSAGGYGKPPTDEHNRPLFGGDVYGSVVQQQQQPSQQQFFQQSGPVDRSLWGEIEPEEEEEESEEEDEDEDEEMSDEAVSDGIRTSGSTWTSMSNAPGDQSLEPGAESVQAPLELRKARGGTESEDVRPRQAGQVLREQNVRNTGFFGSEKQYDLSTQHKDTHVPVLDQEDRSSKRRKVGDVDVSVDVDSLARDDKLSKDELKKQYESQRREEGAGAWGSSDDLSQMIDEERSKRAKMEEDRRRKSSRR